MRKSRKIPFRTARLAVAAAVFLSSVSACSLQASEHQRRARELNDTWRTRHELAPNPNNVTEAYEARGFLSFHLGTSDYFSVRPSDLQTAYDAECSDRPATLRSCDTFDRYHWHVLLDETLTVMFRHVDGMRSSYLAGFYCTLENRNWRCQAEQ